MLEAEAARYIAAAEGFFELGDSLEALRVIDSMPPAAKLTGRAQVLRALLLMSLDRWAEAEAAAALALASPLVSSVVWYSLAVAQAQQQKLTEARESLRSAIDLDDDLRDLARRDQALAGLWTTGN
jgi:tetratricopeptide (TPR) repeat protein